MESKKHYFIPNHLNKEPFRTVWWLEEAKDTLCYIQVSEDQQNPKWMQFGDVLEMLVRRVDNFEDTVLKDVLTALKFHESISPDFIKKHIIR